MGEMARKEDLSHLDMYVKWPQLEDAITNTSTTAERSSPVGGRRTSSQNSVGGSRPVSGRSDSLQTTTTTTTTSPRPPNGYGERAGRADSSSSNRSLRSHRNSRPSSGKQQEAYQPTDNVLNRLHELGMLAERQNSLMDALERTRVI